MIVSALPIEEGINFCQIDGKTHFRLFDVADKLFPNASTHWENKTAQVASSILAQERADDVVMVRKGGVRKGRYLPISEMEFAVELLSEPGVRREVITRSGAIIGSIVKKKREKAMLEEKIEPEVDDTLNIEVIPDMVTGRDGIGLPVSAIYVEPQNVAKITMALIDGKTFVHALEFAKAINPTVSETLHYEAVRKTIKGGAVVAYCRRTSGGRSQRYIETAWLNSLASTLIDNHTPVPPNYSEHIANIERVITKTLDLWPAAATKTAVFNPSAAIIPEREPEAIEVKVDRGQQVVDAFKNMDKRLGVMEKSIEKLAFAIERLANQQEFSTATIVGTVAKTIDARMSELRHKINISKDSLAEEIRMSRDALNELRAQQPQASKPLLARLFSTLNA